MILVSLAVPSIGESVERSRMVRDAAQLRQNMAVLGLYANDHQDIFPVAHPTALFSAREWHRACVAGGYFRSSSEADPAAVRKFGVITLHMSMCLTADSDYMLPGRTLPPGALLSAPVRQHEVAYPSDKGAMLKQFSDDRTLNEGGVWFCCGDPWRAPAVMCDSSVTIADYYAYTGGAYPLVIDGVGIPIWSTWGGYLGRDR